MSHSRRAFLQFVGSVAALSAAGGVTARRARAACPNMNYKILEIFLAGGASHEQTLWVDSNRLASESWFAFDEINWDTITGDPTPPTDTVFNIAGDANVGPSFNALDASTNRPEVLDRLRLVALKHDLDPHDPASVLALNGKTVGRPDRAGLGAAMQHANPGQPPSAVVFDTGSPPRADAAISVGRLDGSPRPILIPMGVGYHDFMRNLPRAGTSTRSDLLWSHYASAYADRLTFAAAPTTRARSKDFDAFDAARSTCIEHANTIRSWMTQAEGIWPDFPPRGTSKDQLRYNRVNWTAASVAASAWLLGQGTIRYAAVIDNGVHKTYDTHGVSPPVGATRPGHHATLHCGNLWNILNTLDIALTGGWFSLEDTLILINTEFGRQWRRSDDGGSDHWYHGYANALIGGPITQPGTAGTICFNATRYPDYIAGAAYRDGCTGDAGYHPTDVRAAVSLAAGVDPFASGVLNHEETTFYLIARRDGVLLTADEVSDRICTDVLGVS
ncbi:MAG: DUF1501 domain-containing protein [Alphaproteobacteria bacterium]|nr:DUF1501 domain-containing protein [Alphaproteobacteria bacterium]